MTEAHDSIVPPTPPTAAVPPALRWALLLTAAYLLSRGLHIASGIDGRILMRVDSQTTAFYAVVTLMSLCLAVLLIVSAAGMFYGSRWARGLARTMLVIIGILGLLQVIGLLLISVLQTVYALPQRGLDPTGPSLMLYVLLKSGQTLIEVYGCAMMVVLLGLDETAAWFRRQPVANSQDAPLSLPTEPMIRARLWPFARRCSWSVLLSALFMLAQGFVLLLYLFGVVRHLQHPGNAGIQLQLYGNVYPVTYVWFVSAGLALAALVSGMLLLLDIAQARRWAIGTLVLLALLHLWTHGATSSLTQLISHVQLGIPLPVAVGHVLRYLLVLLYWPILAGVTLYVLTRPVIAAEMDQPVAAGSLDAPPDLADLQDGES